jgi:hypothetical protein
MENYKTQILLEAGKGRYAIAEPDMEHSDLMPGRDSIDARSAIPYGTQKRLVYTHNLSEDGFFKRRTDMGVMKKRCFDDMLTDLEKMVSTQEADAVLVDVIRCSMTGQETSWVLMADAQLILYR